MNPLEEKLTLVSEIKYNFANVPMIVGKVYRVNDSSVETYEYRWDINFHNQLSAESGVYIPGTATIYAHTQIEAEKKLEEYAMRFVDAVNWSANKSFA